MLEVQGLRCGYGAVPVLHGVDITLRKGEVVGILGHNGMGKSTLLKALVGIVPLTAGRIQLDGADLARMPTHRRARAGLGYVPQGRGIFPALSVRDNLLLAAVASGADDTLLDELLADFPRLAPLLDRQGGALSGGEQQILALARCLAGGPRVLLLDEPTEGIQPSIVEDIIDLLVDLRDHQDLTILLVEQNLEFITALSDRILLLRKGEVSAEFGREAFNDPALINEFVGFAADAGAPAFADARPVGTASAPPSSPLSPPSQNGLSYMTVKRPTEAQMRGIVEGLHMAMGDDELRDYLANMEDTFKAYDRVDTMPDFLPTVDYPRTPGYRPTESENALHAWYVKTDVRGAPRGPLAGKTIALKDNVCLAGVPMMNGASTLEGYVPDVDATVVTRILDAGGRIVGKAHCEYFCLSGGSHTNATGPTHNPHKRGYSAGGSSSGSAALVGAGEVDMAIGGDQGGSIRMPAAFCGCYGMKPTHGLVPYTGVMPIESTIDHTGPMTTTVSDNALFLEVLAGDDGLDPRQYAPRTDSYTEALGRGVRDMRIGVVREGFGHPNSEPDVDAKVREGAERFRAMGATVEEVSLPMHLDGTAIWTPIALEGLTAQMMHGNGMGTNWKGMYTTSLLDAHANWRSRANELSPSLKISMFVGEYFLKQYRGHYYAKAQNLSRQLKAMYDRTLKDFDLLLMPTVPIKATPLPPRDAPLSLTLQRAFEMLANTAPFDVTGHPAMSIPCGMSDGLPIGLMLVGGHYEEKRIYQAAHAFEQHGDWKRW